MKIKNYRVLGIMSGTSLDGLDMALCNFKYLNKKWNFELISTHYIEYSNDWKEKLSNLFYNNKNINKIELQYSEFISESVNNFINKYNLEVDYISLPRTYSFS